MEYSLDKIERLSAALGSPHLSTPPYVHVAGITGKTTFCCALASLLDESTNLRVGRFTYPMNIKPSDCLRINEQPIATDTFSAAASRVAAANKDIAGSLYEQLFMTALLLFREASCDLMIIESGMGGLLDATNILGKSKDSCQLASIITSISHDRVAFIGPSMNDVMRHLTGVSRPGKPTYVIRMPFSSWRTADLVQATPSAITLELRSIDCFGEAVVKIARGIIDSASFITKPVPRPSHRFPIDGEGKIILDSGSVPDAASWLSQVLSRRRQIHRVNWVFGYSAKTKCLEMWQRLKSHIRDGDHVCFPAFSRPEDHPWIAPAEPAGLRKLFLESFGGRMVQVDQVDSMEALLKGWLRCGTTIICGSHYIIRDFYRLHHP